MRQDAVTRQLRQRLRQHQRSSRDVFRAAYSSGRWLYPFRHGIKSIPVGGSAKQKANRDTPADHLERAESMLAAGFGQRARTSGAQSAGASALSNSD